MSAYQALKSMPHSNSMGLRATIEQRIEKANRTVVEGGKQRAKAETEAAREQARERKARAAAKGEALAQKVLDSAEKQVREDGYRAAAKASIQQIKDEARASAAQKESNMNTPTKLQTPQSYDANRLTRLRSSGMSPERHAELSLKRAGKVAPVLEATMNSVRRAEANRFGSAFKPAQTHFTPERLARLRSTGMSPERHVELAQKRLNRR